MVNKSLKVLIVIDSRSIGGIESHVINLAIGLVNRKHQVSIVLLNYHSKHPLIRTLSQFKIPVIALDGKPWDLIKAIKNQRPDLIHTHGYKANIIGRFTGTRTNTPCISTFHNGDMGNGKLRLYTAIDIWTSKYSTNISVSDEIAARLNDNCAAILPNFIPTKETTPIAKGRQIAFVGRLEDVKNPSLFCQLPDLFQGDEFHVYGDGIERDQLEKNAPENLYFHGAVNDMHLRWDEIDLLIMPSLNEGLPLAALEAMSHRVPVLASKVGDLPKLIQHNINGFLFDGRLSELQSALQHWLGLDNANKNKIRHHAMKTIATHFSEDAVIPKVMAIYHAALSTNEFGASSYAIQ